MYPRNNNKNQDLALYALNGGYFGSMRITRKTLEALKEVITIAERELDAAELEDNGNSNFITAGKFFISPLRAESRQVWAEKSNKSLEQVPTHMFKYLTKKEVESYSNKNKTDDLGV